MENRHVQDAVPTKRIIDMLRLVFEAIDPRLMRHGERVAFIADRLYAKLPEYNATDRASLLILALLHDIGAYKTEEIDDMLRFETLNIWPHAVYGYLFLRMTTRLGESAEAVLYHHAPWSALTRTDSRYKTLAALIHLADRIDVLHENGAQLSILETQSGSLFCPDYVELFMRLNEEEGLIAQLESGDYLAEVERALQTLAISDEEILEFLRMMVYAIDFRSPYTVTHTANTMAISVALGRLFELPEQEQTALAQGSFLHDIGKVMVPISILESPGKLSDEEMTLMRTHVTKTGEIICGFVDEKVCRIAVRHHEKLNGEGYPLGLTESELTLPERIVAVADVVSALINRRSYKEPFPREQTLGIIAKMRDEGALCPRVCNMLIAHYDDVLQSAESQADPVIAQYESLQHLYVDLGGHVASLSLHADHGL